MRWASFPTARAFLADTRRLPGYAAAVGALGIAALQRRTVLRRRFMKARLDTMSVIAAAIAVAIWVLVIWTAIAAIVAHM